MAVKVNIKKVLSFTLWCIVGTGVLVLLVAAIGYRNNKTCKGMDIQITGPSGVLFISKKDVVDLLATAGAGKWQGKASTAFDLRRMETVLEKNVWIKDAQLFFDNNGILRVNIVEREPATRIFTRDGNSFYIDSSGAQLPLSDKLPALLPVFTGYPASRIQQHGGDSLLTIQIRDLSGFIQRDSFWMAQIAQVDITPDKQFELVPTVGNHLIEFGDGSDYEQKFHRLFVFYKEVLSHTGFDKYSRIDVAYAGQVIGTKRGSESTREDSVQGMRNIQEMIRNARQLEPDTTRLQAVRPLERNTMTEQSLTNYDLIPEGAGSAGNRADSVAKPSENRKPNDKPKPVDKPKPGDKPKPNDKPRPRAVMPAPTVHHH